MTHRFVSLSRPCPSTSRSVRGLIVWLLAVMSVAVSGHATSLWAEQTPTEIVERTIKDTLYILTELKDASRSAQRQWEIEQVVRRAFNYEEMAERSLGETGIKSNVAERRQFVRLFVQVLRDDLADHLRDYSVAQVVYLAEGHDADGAQVMIAPAGQEVDTRIEFQVVRRSGAWLVNDISIDGPVSWRSIRRSSRASFARAPFPISWNISNRRQSLPKRSTARLLCRQPLSPLVCSRFISAGCSRRGSSSHGSLLFMTTMNGVDKRSDALRLTAPNPPQGVRERPSHSPGV
jgi:phospholipid transport system substrate-binding protein